MHETYEEGESRAINKEERKEFESVHSQRMNQMRTKKSARRIKSALGKFTGGTVTQAEIPLPNGSTRIATREEDIELECLKVNERKFKQTEHTPLMNPPLSDQFGYDDRVVVIQQVLDGTYQAPPGTERYVIELLDQMKHTGTYIPNEAQETSTLQFKEG